MIRLLSPADGEKFFEHVLRHFRESGQGGDPIFHPVLDFEEWKSEDHLARYEARWKKPVGPAVWERVWALEEGGRFLGHATLQGGMLPASAHRATFSIGLERAVRGRGLGRELTQCAIDWAKQQPTLAWIDLYAFAHNEPALRLYRSMGFREIGTTKDLFRVDGHSIDDAHMALALQRR